MGDRITHHRLAVHFQLMAALFQNVPGLARRFTQDGILPLLSIMKTAA